MILETKNVDSNMLLKQFLIDPFSAYFNRFNESRKLSKELEGILCKYGWNTKINRTLEARNISVKKLYASDCQNILTKVGIKNG